MPGRLCPLALVIVLAACPGGKPEGGPVGREERPARGGILSIVLAEDVDFLDPQRAGQPPAIALLRALHRGLMAFPPVAGAGGATPVPDLAESPPAVSADGRTFTFRLREGVAFGAPASRPVVASDVRAGLERLLAPGSVSPYAGYFRIIEGSAAFSAGRASAVTGVSAPDDRTVVVRLSRPYNDLPWLLALPAASAVPSELARTTNPAPAAIAGAGPYVLAPVDGYRPEEGMRLVRNASWRPETDPVRPAYVDEIHVTIAGGEAGVAPAIAAGAGDFSLDTPPDLATKPDPARTFAVAAGCLRYLWMNARLKPFDDVRVRRAVAAAIDRTRILTAAGGELAGVPTATSMVRTLLGGPANPEAPDPDPAAARELLDVAGKSQGLKTRLVVGDRPIDVAQGRAVVSALNAAGFTVSLGTMPISSLYVDGYEVPANRIPMGIATWCADWPGLGGRSHLTALLGPSRIRARGNQNYSTLLAPSLQRLLAAAAVAPPDRAAGAWEAASAEVERLVPWVPLLDLNEVTVVSSRIGRFVAPPLLPRGDPTAIWLRKNAPAPVATVSPNE